MRKIKMFEDILDRLDRMALAEIEQELKGLPLQVKLPTNDEMESSPYAE